MKYQCVFLLCAVLHLSTGSLITEDFEKSLDYLQRIRKHTHGHNDENVPCQVEKFSAVQNLDLGKLDGDWFEIFRTAVGVVRFKSGAWRIQHKKGSRSQQFIFTAKLQNDQCMNPLHGEIIQSPSSSASFIMKYRGLKGKIEEEYKVIDTDYKNKLVLYACRDLLPDGECASKASVLIILSKYHSLSPPVQDSMKGISSTVCIEPSSLIDQNSEDACSFDEVEAHLPEFANQDPTCKTKSPCTIACPICCEEKSNGCIECRCGGDPQDNDNDEGCVYDLSSCPSSKCNLEEKKPGCFECNCPVVLRAPPALKSPPYKANGASLRLKIDDVRNCPTTCRIVEDSSGMTCDCSNKLQCQPLPPNLPLSCTEKGERWYFDDRTATCHGFYGSCLDGEPNNFKSLKECISTCADICELPIDVGTCHDNELRYYFNRNRGVCDKFVYKGCGGNHNNFKSEAICKHQCPEWMDTSESNPRPEKCYQPAQKGHCQESHIRYFYLPVTRTCTSFFFSGCGENENNFKSKLECEQACIALQTGPKVCPDIKDCPCSPQERGDECSVCDCTEQDPDGGLSLTASTGLLLIASCFLWLSRRQ